ncbi:MAG: FecR domain-containing protein [Sphingobium sp.]
MSPSSPSRDQEIIAEAALWLARLRSDAEDSKDQRGAFRSWLNADPRHGQTFDEMTARWEAAAAVDRSTFDNMETVCGGIRRKLLVPAGMMVIAVAALASLALLLLSRPDAPSPAFVHATPVGVQESVRLADGSLLSLDADSAVTVSFTPDERRLRLDRGQARFDVAHDPHRRFVVQVDGLDVVALGTAFDISRDKWRQSVTLLRGSVRVARNTPGDRPVTLTPGQRLIDRGGSIIIDRPDPEDIDAWRKGILLFDNDPLAEAVAMMNRHARRPLRLRGDLLNDRRISGTYDAHDAEAFARTVGTLLSVPVAFEADSIIIG